MYIHYQGSIYIDTPEKLFYRYVLNYICLSAILYPLAMYPLSKTEAVVDWGDQISPLWMPCDFAYVKLKYELLTLQLYILEKVGVPHLYA